MTDTTISGAVPGILGAVYQSGQVPETLDNAIPINPWTDAAGHRALVRIPGVARYLIEEGRKIVVQAEPGADRESVELFLNGSVRGYLIHQRGEVPLDAATVVAPNGAAVALSSTSGLGKSTLAAELCRRGWLLAADNITRVTLTAGRVLAWPSDDKVVLWRSACDGFAIDVNSLQPIRRGMQKFYVPMPAARGPAPLKFIVRILRGETVARIEDVSREDAAAALPQWLFRWHQITAKDPASQAPATLRRMSETCRVANLSGARECAPFELADLIARMVT